MSEGLKIYTENQLCLLDVAAANSRLAYLNKNLDNRHVTSYIRQALRMLVTVVHATPQTDVDTTIMFQNLVSNFLFSEETKNLVEERETRAKIYQQQNNNGNNEDEDASEKLNDIMSKTITNYIQSQNLNEKNAKLAATFVHFMDMYNPFNLCESVEFHQCEDKCCGCHAFLHDYSPIGKGQIMGHRITFGILVKFLAYIDHCSLSQAKADLLPEMRHKNKVVNINIKALLLGSMNTVGGLPEFESNDIKSSTTEENTHWDRVIFNNMIEMDETYMTMMLGVYSGLLFFPKLRRGQYNDTISAFECFALRIIRYTCELIFYDHQTLITNQDVILFSKYSDAVLQVKSLCSSLSMGRQIKALHQEVSFLQQKSFLKDAKFKYGHGLLDILHSSPSLVETLCRNPNEVLKWVDRIYKFLSLMGHNASPDMPNAMYYPYGEYNTSKTVVHQTGNHMAYSKGLKTYRILDTTKEIMNNQLGGFATNHFTLLSNVPSAYFLGNKRTEFYDPGQAQSTLDGTFKIFLDVMEEGKECHTKADFKEVCKYIKSLDTPKASYGNYLGFMNAKCHMAIMRSMECLSNNNNDIDIQNVINNFIQEVFSSTIVDSHLMNNTMITFQDLTKDPTSLMEDKTNDRFNTDCLVFNIEIKDTVKRVTQWVKLSKQAELEKHHQETGGDSLPRAVQDRYNSITSLLNSAIENPARCDMKKLCYQMRFWLDNYCSKDIGVKPDLIKIPTVPKKKGETSVLEDLMMRHTLQAIQRPGISRPRLSTINTMQLESSLGFPEWNLSFNELGRVDVVTKIYYFVNRYCAELMNSFFEIIKSGEANNDENSDAFMIQNMVMKGAPEAENMARDPKVMKAYKNIISKAREMALHNFMDLSNSMNLHCCYNVLYSIVNEHDMSSYSILANMEQVNTYTACIRDIFINIVHKLVSGTSSGLIESTSQSHLVTGGGVVIDHDVEMV